MELVDKNISLLDLKQMAQSKFGNFVKAVIDIEKGIMAVDADLHADEEAFLLDKGSKQQNLWGINIYPDNEKDSRVEFDSMINLKPSQNNRTRSVEDQKIRQQIIQIISKIVNP